MAVQRLTEEANLVMHFREDFMWLSDQLTYVRGFLQDADQKSQQREHVKHWLEKIRVISLLAEDICEECAVESKYRNNAQSCGLSCNQLIFRYRIGRKIKDIKGRMSSIIEDGKKLELFHQVSSANEALPSTSQRAEWKRSSLLPSDSDSHSVGIQSRVDEMLRLLDNDASPVIAVVGMGGIGKTHLLQHVYNRIKERYEKSIWLSVSQSYSISKLQKDLVFQINDEDLSKRVKETEVSEPVLAPVIYEWLKGKSCLVVLDDVWRAGGEDDLFARLGLPSANNNPCKIVVTTRSRDVCTNLNAKIYEMKYLSDEDSWRLFCVYAFEEGREPPQQLEEVGRKIVEQCGNLPLAIKTIAASLAKTRMPRDWESKLQQLQGVQGTANVDPIMPILRLSYDSSSTLLKACFAYLSFFPEDEKIDCEYLIYLWIGEGFIPAGEDQWDAAWNCLYQLANLCLIQLWEEETCKDTSGDFCRILLVKKDINDDDISESRPVCLRTFSLSQNERISRIPTNLFTAMRGLRVLDLSGTKISAVPKSIGKMKLLKVLNLRYTDIREVPECVRHLKSLLFLVLPEGCQTLPVWINELKCLQHIECEGVSRMAKGISKMLSLRTLRSAWLNLSVEEEELMRSEDLGNMTQLQELWLNVNHEMELEVILARLVKMRRLFIDNEIAIELLELPKKMTAMKDLENLYLRKFVVPSWICGFANLRELELNGCDCSDYPELQIMPNLVRLELYGNIRCRELPKAFGKAGGFPQLRFLKIDWFRELEEFPELEEGAMACLEELKLWSCPKVKKVGEGLERLKRLRVFDYSRSGTSEVKEKFKEGGEYWHKIKSNNPHPIISG
ncbi:hypothetical protein SUGI_0393480 [Cryptomeria japonica]|uniref:putative disease resistance protein RGA3 n=1 Tax=Cryptomeria japonica TaxID=3369 RepID=UPI002408C371|nr:putative disease resistance protein RGA3 [Cryptomeria japonica]GLJ21379.1 hypothetical protein SUGI_0393480 [Cryptomeria japonica]